MSSGFSSSAKANAVAALSANIQAYSASIQSIASDKKAQAKLAGSDYVVVGIPPLEIVPTFAHQVSSSVSKSDALAFLKQLSDQYNAGLQKITSSLKGSARGSRVYYYDLAKLVSRSLGHFLFSNPLFAKANLDFFARSGTR